MKKFNELPTEIQERMLDEQVQQGNKRSADVFEENVYCDAGEGGFTWGRSAEGHDFWYEIIIKGNFAVFYGRYPKTPTHDSN